MSSEKPKRPDIKFTHRQAAPEATLAIKLDLPEVSVDRLPALQAPSDDKMEKMRAKAAGWKVAGSVGRGIEVKEVPQGSGNLLYAATGTGLVLTGDPRGPEPGEFRYQTMPRTMKGFWPLKLTLGAGDEMKLYYFNTRTRGVFFLLYDIPMEELYEKPQIMALGVDFKKKDSITDEKGKRMSLSRITSKELSSILGLAATASVLDSIEPRDENVDWRNLQRKLRDVRVAKTAAEGFSMHAFVEGMMFGFPSKDEFGSHYSITSGEAQDDFRLYVNPGSQGNPPNCVLVASFRYNRDNCLLFKEV